MAEMKKILAILLLPIAACAHEVISVADGDTLTLLVHGNPLKIRLANIDAPEKAQAFGHKSKQSLANLCLGSDAEYQKHSIDRYGRTVASVTCGGIDAGRAQVERGMAWVYVRYNKDASLPAIEQQTKEGNRGLWADESAIAPWKFREKLRGQSQRKLSR